MEYPDLIKNLPECDIPFKDINGKLFQGKNHQIVFFEIPGGTKLPAHSHGAQWGVVLEGEMELTIGGQTKNYSKGDSYYIKNGEEHQATFLTDIKVLDFFEDSDRYKEKK